MNLSRPNLPGEIDRRQNIEQDLPVDIKRILYRSFRNWYWFLISCSFALLGAFLVNRYSEKTYLVNASLIVKEAGDVSGAEMLYSNPLVNLKRNYLNEPYIIRSHPLVQEVIEELNFDAIFFREGNVITREAYHDLPIRSVPIRESIHGPVSFEFRTLNAKTFELRGTDHGGNVQASVFAFGDTVSFLGYKGVFYSAEFIEEVVGMTLIFSYRPSSDVVTEYTQRLNVEWAEEGAGVVNLSMTGSNPKKGQDFLLGLVSNYQARDLELKNETASRTVSFISEQLALIADSLVVVESALQKFKGRNIVTDLSGEALRLYQKLEELEAQKAQILINRNYYDHLIAYTEKAEEGRQMILPSSVGIDDQILSDLISRMNQLQVDLKMISKEENPLVKAGKVRLAEIRKDIIESVRNQRMTEDIRLSHLEGEIKIVENALARVPIAERSLIAIQRNYTLLENLYMFLLQKRSEAAITRASNTSDIMLINPPKMGVQVGPKTTYNYMLALVLGVIVPMVIFGVREVLDDKVQAREDIERVTSIPFIGALGRSRVESRLAVLSGGRTALAESFRALRSNLNFFVSRSGGKVFVVTSSISGEGKSFTSLNLASVFSLSGKDTIVIGADLRRPKMFEDFGLPNDVGLSNYLAGHCSFDEIVKRTTYDHLDFLTAGPVPPNPSELLLNDRFDDLISRLRDRYEYIVIDTPPLALVTDAFLVARQSDHVLFLVRQNYTPKVLLKAIDDHFITGQLKNVSILLNDVYKAGPGYSQTYEYAYGYQGGSGLFRGRRGEGSYYDG